MPGCYHLLVQSLVDLSPEQQGLFSLQSQSVDFAETLSVSQCFRGDETPDVEGVFCKRFQLPMNNNLTGLLCCEDFPVFPLFQRVFWLVFHLPSFFRFVFLVNNTSQFFQLKLKQPPPPSEAWDSLALRRRRTRLRHPWQRLGRLGPRGALGVLGLASGEDPRGPKWQSGGPGQLRHEQPILP